MSNLRKIEPKSSYVCNTFYQMCKKYLEEEYCLHRRKGGKVKLAAYHAKISSVKGEKKIKLCARVSVTVRWVFLSLQVLYKCEKHTLGTGGSEEGNSWWRSQGCLCQWWRCNSARKKAARNEVMLQVWISPSCCCNCVAGSLGHSVGQLWVLWLK